MWKQNQDVSRSSDRPGNSSRKMIQNPITGERMIFRTTASETGGKLFQTDFFMKPHSKGLATVTHVQPALEQRLEVISGEMSYTLGSSKKKIAKRGERVIIPPKVPHSVWNESDQELHALDEYIPAYNMEKFFETAYGLAKDGKCNKKTGAPTLPQLAVMLRGFRREIGAGSPSGKLLAALTLIIAPMARARGYRAWYPKYTEEKILGNAGSN
jgi:mannose-6-phosphate isomerase-like protein (cupin superfamily)